MQDHAACLIRIVAGLFTLLFTRLLGRVKGAILALVGSVLYTLLMRAGLSVVRAALMGGLGLFATPHLPE